MKRAALLLSISIALCSACAARPEVAPARVLGPVPCAAPVAPVLPRIDGDIPLDHPGNVNATLERDSRLRRYISGLRAALNCYDAQVVQ